MAYIHRIYAKRFRALKKQFPIICILGPRQCGKTTFARKHLSKWKYFDLEKPSDHTQVFSDPEYVLNQHQKNIIFDEAQLVPQLFSTLRAYVDEKKFKTTSIVLLGSASFQLMQNISETLAGRVGFVDLTPFQLSEVKLLNKLWLVGGYPDAFLKSKGTIQFDWYESYVRTFIERDLNILGISISATQMRKLWRMLSHVHGGLWNASELASSLGSNYHTVNRYVDILEQTFLVRKLEPFFANVKKRMVRSPKIYLRDSGILHYFLGIQNRDDLDAHPKKGASWEGFAIEQIINFIKLRNPQAEFYFWRTATGQEVDLLIKIGQKITPIEIKTHSSPVKSSLKGMVQCMKDLNLKSGVVINPKCKQYSLGSGIKVMGLEQFVRPFGLAGAIPSTSSGQVG